MKPMSSRLSLYITGAQAAGLRLMPNISLINPRTVQSLFTHGLIRFVEPHGDAELTANGKAVLELIELLDQRRQVNPHSDV
jgi:hypothetical protein